jgi:hypothetical protein
MDSFAVIWLQPWRWIFISSALSARAVPHHHEQKQSPAVGLHDRQFMVVAGCLTRMIKSCAMFAIFAILLRARVLTRSSIDVPLLTGQVLRMTLDAVSNL